MNATTLSLVAAVCLSPFCAHAQEPTPTPTPTPCAQTIQLFNDISDIHVGDTLELEVCYPGATEFSWLIAYFNPNTFEFNNVAWGDQNRAHSTDNTFPVSIEIPADAPAGPYGFTSSVNGHGDALTFTVQP